MTRVDFYVLTASDQRAYPLFTCRLIEKAYRMRKRVFVRCRSSEHCRELDDLLWTFRQGSFIPHAQAQSPSDDLSQPVVIGTQCNTGSCDVLVNLGDDIPEKYTDFPRVIEIVGNDEESTQRGRQRFRTYRDTGLKPQTHKITN